MEGEDRGELEESRPTSEVLDVSLGNLGVRDAGSVGLLPEFLDEVFIRDSLTEHPLSDLCPETDASSWVVPWEHSTLLPWG